MVAVNGDVLSGTDLKSLIERHKETEALATITLTSVEDPTAYGLVEVDHDMVVRRFIEKPAADEVTTNLVNAGIYVLEPEVLEMIPPGREVSIEREIFSRAAGAGPAAGARLELVLAGHRDAAQLPRRLPRRALRGGGGPARGFEYCDVDGSVRKGKNVKLLPPVSVAAGCEIDSLATIGGRSALGRGCRVGAGAVVEGSILLEGAEVEAGAVVRGSIIGKGARVGQDAIVRGLSVLGAGCVVGEGNVLDQDPGEPRGRAAAKSLRF